MALPWGLLYRAMFSLLVLSCVNTLVTAEAAAVQEQCVLREEVARAPRSLEAAEKFLGAFGDGPSCEAECATVARRRRVAVIGAGSGGTSAAYFLRKYSFDANVPLDITIYERNDYVGGRSITVTPFLDQDEETPSDLRSGNNTSNISRDKYPSPVELGASIFVSVNYNLRNASHDLHLNTTATTNEAGDDSGQATGIWNGSKFVFIEPGSEPKNPIERYWNMVKMVWRYGVLGPYRATTLVRKVLDSFLQIYEPSHFPFKSLSSVVRDLGLHEFVGQTALDMLKKAGATTTAGGNTKDGGFAWELVQAANRVNYASNLASIHGVGAMVCMAPTLSDDDSSEEPGVMQVEGGNWQIFEGMATAAAADIKLGREVTEITKTNSASPGDGSSQVACQCDKNIHSLRGAYRIRSRKSSAKRSDPPRTSSDQTTGLPAYEAEEYFDAVILAAPFQSAYIEFGSENSTASTDNLASSTKPLLQYTPSPISYKTLHVTLFAANRGLSPAYFNVSAPKDVPGSVLTTLPPPEEDNYGNRPPFYSMSTLRGGVRDPACTEASSGKQCDSQRLYKIFSAERVGDNFIEGTLLENGASVSWIYRKIWKAYPILKPRPDGVEEPLRLDAHEDDALKEQLGGIWYIGGIEPFISTMETSSLMGKNVARLIADGWERQKSPSS
ncbi:MAG: hypothetical protein M1831_005228 [Alyxoria varia]|nr:MAG: hypothetical protein M1831_005228 [Alyxoria varia]